ncbi:MAG TPA: hypothetical protein PLI95_20340 [Polyangiaceae bacterium]|nr:hypothetical protein [Polyangiaceae bacterium]
MTYRRLGSLASLAVVGAVLLAASPALAEDEDSKGDSEKTEASAKVSTKDVKLRSTTEPDSDHALLVGAFGVGYLGAGDVPFPTNAATSTAGGIASMTATGSTLSAPVVGMRYWLSDLIGLDVGVGFLSYGGSVKRHVGDLTNIVQADIKSDKVSQMGAVLHAGVPLALHAEKHWVFQVVPELNVGFSSGTQKAEQVYIPPGGTAIYPNDIKLSGMLFDFGVRAGTEIHFGFIGVPNLSLQAGIGLMMQYRKFQAKGGGNPDPAASTPDTTYAESSMTIGTSVQDSPWAIFTKNVAALYYF